MNKQTNRKNQESWKETHPATTGQEAKERIADFTERYFDTFLHDFGQLEDKPDLRVKIYIEMTKLLLSKTSDNEESDQNRQLQSRLLQRLFPPN
jgi:hypothetical protein